MDRVGLRARRLAIGLGSLVAAIAAVPGGWAVPGPGQALSGPAAATISEPVVREAVAFATSKPLRSLKSTAQAAGPFLPLRLQEPSPPLPAGPIPDPVAQRAIAGGGIPAPDVSFDGIPQATGPLRPIPPDTVGDVGPSHYVQMVNLRYAVFDKTGKLLVGPVDTRTLFEPLGDVCGVTNEGDPIVVYDQLADRWVLSQFGFVDVFAGPYYECIAVSKTGDPTGAYHLYAFKINDTELNDYPKLAVWPDAYYMSVNQFAQPELFFSGVGVVAFERERMLAGDPSARMVYFDLFQRFPNVFSLLPSDLDGMRLPPAGAPSSFLGLGLDLFTGFKNELHLFQFHADWSDPARSTFVGPTVVPVAAYDPNLCGFDRSCIPQQGTFEGLDALSSRLMFRLAYRNLGDHESLVVNHTVDVGDDRAGIRWYELRNPRGGATVYQQGTFAPDSAPAASARGALGADPDHRWMGSIAMDGNGNIALGYSVSSPSRYPSIRYTGRLAGDAPGEMTLGEGTLVEGGGAQTHPAGRWGDYSSLTVDPLDDCTFWYTQEYYKTTSERGWSTRVGSFTFPSCDATAPSVQALPASGKARKPVRLRYRVSDNKEETRESIVVLRPNGRVLRRLATGFGPATGGVDSVTMKAPPVPGSYSFCVTASDRKGNESAESCARLRVRL